MSDITWTNDTRNLSDLVPWEHNPKRMSKKQADGLRLSIERFGFAVPFLVSPDGDIYDGHQRQTLMGAIKEYGPNAVVDVRVSSRPLTDDERRELVVRLKQNQAGWDFDMLPNLYDKEELLEWGFEPEELGMFPDDAKPDDPGPQIDKAEELREKWGVETGQLWQLGEHRLICGDCTDAAVVTRVMDGERARLVFTSPPYADIRTYTKENDLSPVYLAKFISSSVQYAEYFVINLGIKREDGQIVEYWNNYIEAARLEGLRFLAWNVWSRHGFGGSVGNMTAMFPIEHEWLFVFGSQEMELNLTIPNKHGGKVVSATVRDSDGQMSAPQTSAVRSFGKLGSVFVSDVARGEKEHPAMFPTELPEAYISACTDTGLVILDPFLGSGTTLIACERLGRKCRAVEISPAYCAVAIQRWVDMTGGVPVLLDAR